MLFTLQSTVSGSRVLLDILNSTLGNYLSSICTSPGPHLYKPVRIFKHLCIMIYENHGVTIMDKIMHNCF